MSSEVTTQYFHDSIPFALMIAVQEDEQEQTLIGFVPVDHLQTDFLMYWGEMLDIWQIWLIAEKRCV